MSTIRVVRETCTSFGPIPVSTDKILWVGIDITQLSQQYPSSDIMGADELGYTSLEDGYITMQTRFEELNKGQWQPIADPRIRLTNGLSELEREVDAENRRMFPGDYITEDDDVEGPRDDLKWNYEPDSPCRHCNRSFFISELNQDMSCHDCAHLVSHSESAALVNAIFLPENQPEIPLWKSYWQTFRIWLRQ